MSRLLKPQIVLVLLPGIVTLLSVSCGSNNPVGDAGSNAASVAAASQPHTAVDPSPTLSAPTGSVAQPPSQPDPYQRALARASSAFSISQSAQSQDDWRLVASRWQQAIALMTAVPPSNTNHGVAQTKLREYQRNLAYAQQQINRPTNNTSASPLVVLAPRETQEPNQPSPMNAAAPSQRFQSGSGVFQAPIIRRMAGTPVINVTFNGSQNFEMILDTGASGTLITRQMAAVLNVVPIGQAQVDTASARDVSFPLGYVSSMNVGGAIARNVVVAVAGPDLGIGLLGHDFFGNYDIIIRQNDVEFRER